jgi:non-heme chloroperoxidase
VHAGRPQELSRLQQGPFGDGLTDDLKKFDIPTLILHGDDDQIVPIHITAMQSSKLVKNATFKVYQGAPHALMATHQEQFNGDLLAFIKA